MVCLDFLDIRQPTSHHQLLQMRTSMVSWEECWPFLGGRDEAGIGGSQEEGRHSQVTVGRAPNQEMGFLGDGVSGGYRAGGDMTTSQCSLWKLTEGGFERNKTEGRESTVQLLQWCRQEI